MNELPIHFMLDSWKKTVNRRVLYDGYGNLLDEDESSSLDLAKRKMVSEIHQAVDDTIRLAEHSPEELEALRNILVDMKEMCLKGLLPTILVDKTSLRHILVVLCLIKSKFIHQLMSIQKGDAKELRGT